MQKTNYGFAKRQKEIKKQKKKEEKRLKKLKKTEGDQDLQQDSSVASKE